MTPEDAKIIFGNISEIAVFADMFAEELELALGSFVEVEDGQGTDAVGALFLRIVSLPLPQKFIRCFSPPEIYTSRHQTWNGHTIITSCDIRRPCST